MQPELCEETSRAMGLSRKWMWSDFEDSLPKKCLRIEISSIFIETCSQRVEERRSRTNARPERPHGARVKAREPEKSLHVDIPLGPIVHVHFQLPPTTITGAIIEIILIILIVIVVNALGC